MSITRTLVGAADSLDRISIIILTGTDDTALQPQTTLYSIPGYGSLFNLKGGLYTPPSDTSFPTTSSATPTPTPSPTPSNTSTPTPTSSPSASITPDSAGFTSAAKVGLGVGLSLGVICIILITAIVFLLRRKRIKKTEGANAEPGYGIEGAPGYGTDAEPVVTEGKK